jgi:ABC-2 type transport system ATP-binding protein
VNVVAFRNQPPGHNPSMPIIEVHGLRKTYGATVAVDSIDLAVDEGEIFGVLGPNGSGKTTTIECIAGLRRPDAGTVRVAGLDPASDRAEITRQVGVQLQEAGLQAKLTVREALALFAAFYDDPLDGIELAERLGLGPKLDTRYRDLSGGQKQRLAISLALIGRPRVALLDELTTGLDPRNRREVWAVIEDLRDQGATIVLVTHSMEEAEHLCDRLALIDRGRISALDTTAGIIGRTGSPTVMAFSPSRPFAAGKLAGLEGVSGVRQLDGRVEATVTDEGVLAVLDWLTANDIRPGRLRVTESSLDDAYLSLIREGESVEATSGED